MRGIWRGGELGTRGDKKKLNDSKTVSPFSLSPYPFSFLPLSLLLLERRGLLPSCLGEPGGLLLADRLRSGLHRGLAGVARLGLVDGAADAADFRRRRRRRREEEGSGRRSGAEEEDGGSKGAAARRRRRLRDWKRGRGGRGGGSDLFFFFEREKRATR